MLELGVGQTDLWLSDCHCRWYWGCTTSSAQYTMALCSTFNMPRRTLVASSERLCMNVSLQGLHTKLVTNSFFLSFLPSTERETRVCMVLANQHSHCQNCFGATRLLNGDSISFCHSRRWVWVWTNMELGPDPARRGIYNTGRHWEAPLVHDHLSMCLF